MRLVRLLHRLLVRQTMPAMAVAYYDQLVDAVAGIYLEPFRDEVLRAFPGPLRILDIGTGTGQLLTLLAQANPLYRLTGIDLSARCLAVARARVAAAGLDERVEVLRRDILRDDWAPEPFDLIVSTCSLHHWRHPVRMLRAARKLLAAGAEAWIMDDADDAPPHARRRWVTEVERAFRPSPVFRSVFAFESRFLAYSRTELESLCARARLRIRQFTMSKAFFLARIAPA